MNIFLECGDFKKIRQSLAHNYDTTWMVRQAVLGQLDHVVK